MWKMNDFGRQSIYSQAMPLQHQIIGYAVSSVVAAAATAQVPPLLRPIDASVEDINPLSASLRQIHSDLLQPSGFQHVYRVPGHDDLLMRVSGGVYAVFPESDYATNRDGRTVPQIPAGTIFYIGLPTKLTTPGHVTKQSGAGIEPTVRLASELNSRSAIDIPDAAVRTMIDSKIGDVDQNGMPIAPTQQPPGQADRAPSAMADPARLEGPLIVNDSDYRARRLDELLQRAAAAAAHRNS
jgi:hypothetical protein